MTRRIKPQDEVWLDLGRPEAEAELAEREIRQFAGRPTQPIQVLEVPVLPGLPDMGDGQLVAARCPEHAVQFGPAFGQMWDDMPRMRELADAPLQVLLPVALCYDRTTGSPRAPRSLR